MVEQLLSDDRARRPLINSLDLYGSSPLFHAVQESFCSENKQYWAGCSNTGDNPYQSIIEVLLAQGADPNQIIDQTDRTPTTLAFDYYILHKDLSELKNTLSLLIAHNGDVSSYINRDDGNFEPDTPLLRLCRTPIDSEHHVANLIAWGVNVNFRGKNGESALHVVVDCLCRFSKKHHYSALLIIRLLIQAGANIDTQDKWGTTPLMKVCLRSFKDLVQELLAAGASVNLKDVQGNTALHNAAYRGNKKIVSLLISKNRPQRSNLTPLEE